MGQLILDNAVQALCDGGIPASRAMPAAAVPQITESVAAVCLRSMDMRTKKLTLTVTVLTPAGLGAGACEETALAAGQILTDLGGKCSVAECSFHGRNGLFYTEITAEFNSEVPKVTIDGILLTHVLAFTSWRSLDEEENDWNSAKWNFRLEEYFPMGVDDEADPEGTFYLVHISPSGTENYANCTWTYQRRVWDASGIRQIRLGIAEDMSDG